MFAYAPVASTRSPLTVTRRQSPGLTQADARTFARFKQGEAIFTNRVRPLSKQGEAPAANRVSASAKQGEASHINRVSAPLLPVGPQQMRVLAWLANRQKLLGGINTGVVKRRVLETELQIGSDTLKSCLRLLIRAGRLQRIGAPVVGRREEAGSCYAVPPMVVAALEGRLNRVSKQGEGLRSSSSFISLDKTTTTEGLYRFFGESIEAAGIGDRVSASDCIRILRSSDAENRTVRPWRAVGADAVLNAVIHMASYVKTPQGKSVKQPKHWIPTTLINLGPACVSDSKFALPLASAKQGAPILAPEREKEEIQPPEYDACVAACLAQNMSIGQAHLKALGVNFRID